MRCLEIVRICCACTLERLDKPESYGFNKTSKGYTRLVLDVMGKIVNVVEALLL